MCYFVNCSRLRRVVGERPDNSEGYSVRRTGVVGSENAGMSSVWM